MVVGGGSNYRGLSLVSRVRVGTRGRLPVNIAGFFVGKGSYM